MAPANPARPDPGDAVQRWLVGRDQELQILHDLVDEADTRGHSLVVRGEAGIGKSALIRAVSQRAREGGIRVEMTSGTESEARLAFGGLHRLLLPFTEGVRHLPAPQRRALEIALGVEAGERPDGFLVGLAVLGVLTEDESAAPLLLVVDDAHWLDQSSADVLTFVARRLEMERVVLLFAVRDGVPCALDGAGLPELTVSGLDDEASRLLLKASGHGLAQPLLDRILVEAAGNPLALIELPTAVGPVADGASAGRGEPLPLTSRLEAAFATRLTSLDAHVRSLLLLAALDDGDLTELSRAAEVLLDVSVDVNSWTMAAASGLGTLGAGRFRFRHPLMRSAVEQAATVVERRRAHAALARVLPVESDRAVWHRAAAADGPDEEVASGLEALADRASARGALDVAFDALDRAAALTTDPQRRALRLHGAGHVALELGRTEECVPRMRAALALGLPEHVRFRTSFELEGLTRGWSGASTIPRFAEIAEELSASGDGRDALDAIYSVSVRAHWGPLDDETRRRVASVVERLDAPPDDAWRISALALIDPVGRGREVIARLRGMSPVGIVDNHELMAHGRAASAVWADDLALPFLRAASDGYRADGRLAMLAQSLVYEAWADVRMGAPRMARVGAAEAATHAAEARQVRFVVVAQLAHAIAAAELGEDETAERLTSEAESVLLPMGTNPLLALVALARGRAALATDRPREAYAELVRIFVPTTTSYQPFVRGWALADLTEAAVHGEGDLDLVRAVLAEWEEIAEDTTAPHLQAQLAYAAALLADDATAEERFLVATTTGATTWPFYVARAQLAYGAWLRRQRRDVEARVLLREAGQVFDALGQRRLAERAHRELRATGERARRRDAEAWSELSPQELQIAQLAADGLSNREIGERLYLSHRTVGTHLYRLFPKLGITSRAQLRDALGPAQRA